MARTKTKPPPKSSWQVPPEWLNEHTGSPRTPEMAKGTDVAQQATYPTPNTPTKSRSNNRALGQQTGGNDDCTQYGRWSSSGKSWFVNRRSIPGDRPPPPGIFYRYGRRLSFTKPRSPTPQRLLTPEISSDDSEPVVRRARRRTFVAPLEVSDDESIDDGSGIQQEKADVSSDNSEPVVRRSGRGVVLGPSATSDDEFDDDGSGIQQEKADVSSDDSEPVVRRARRGVVLRLSITSDDETNDDGSGIQQEEPDVSGDDQIIDHGSNIQKEKSDVSSDDSEPIIRRSRREAVRRPLKTSDDETIDDRPSIQREDPDTSSDDPDPIIIRRRRRAPAETIVPKCSTTLSVGDDTDISDSDRKAPRNEASIVGDVYDRVQNRNRNIKARTEQTRSRSPRSSRRVGQQYRRRSTGLTSASRDAGTKKVKVAFLSNRRGGATEEVRMTREELRNEEDVLEVSPPAESEASEYEEDGNGEGDGENESAE